MPQCEGHPGISLPEGHTENGVVATLPQWSRAAPVSCPRHTVMPIQQSGVSAGTSEVVLLRDLQLLGSQASCCVCGLSGSHFSHGLGSLRHWLGLGLPHQSIEEGSAWMPGPRSCKASRQARCAQPLAVQKLLGKPGPKHHCCHLGLTPARLPTGSNSNSSFQSSKPTSNSAMSGEHAQCAQGGGDKCPTVGQPWDGGAFA